MRRRSRLTGLVVLAVAAIAIAATVDAVRRDPGRAGGAELASEAPDGDGGPGERLTGPDLPPPGALEGMLVFADRDVGCRLTMLSLSTLRPAPTSLETGCRLWASPSGRLAVIALPEKGQPLALVRFRPRAEVLSELGEVLGDPSWSPDGARVAWCGGQEGQLFSVTIATPVESRRETLPGCAPRFAADGSLLVRSLAGSELWNGSGEVELSADDLLLGLDDGLGQDPEILGYDKSPDGTLAVTAAIRGSADTTVLELWQAGTLEVSVPVRGGQGMGQLLRFSPDGTVFAIGPPPDPTGGPVTFVDLRLRRPTLEVTAPGGFAWSPEGAWLAVAEEGEVVIYSRDSDQPVYRLPISARGLSWVVEKSR